MTYGIVANLYYQEDEAIRRFAQNFDKYSYILHRVARYCYTAQNSRLPPIEEGIPLCLYRDYAGHSNTRIYPYLRYNNSHNPNAKACPGSSVVTTIRYRLNLSLMINIALTSLTIVFIADTSFLVRCHDSLNRVFFRPIRSVE